MKSVILAFIFLQSSLALAQPAPPSGHGEPLRLGTAATFGPINNGFQGVLTLADWNADGLNDLIVFSIGYRGGLFLYRQLPGDKGHRFSEQERIDGRFGLPDVGEGIYWWGHKPIGASWWIDLNGDSLPDLVSGTSTGLVVFPNTGRLGSPHFGAPTILGVKGGDRFCFADLDGDGIADLLTGRGDNRRYWPTFDPVKMSTTLAGPVYPGRYLNGRWLGNNPKGEVLFHKGLGKMRYDTGKVIIGRDSLAEAVGALRAAAGDWNGDGRLELAVTDRVGNLFLFINRGSDWVRIADRHFKFSELRPVLGKLKPNAPRDDLFLVTESGFILWLKSKGKNSAEAFSFEEPVRLSCRNAALSAGNFAVPTVGDMDSDGDLDLVVGNEDGYLTYFVNEGTGGKPVFGLPVLIKAGGETVYLAAGPAGSPQGPEEAAYGYTCPRAADWDLDGRTDIILSDIRGRYYFLRNTGRKGTDGAPEFEGMVLLTSGAKPLETVWRVRPVVFDVDHDGLPDLVTLNRWGQFSWFKRKDRANDLLPAQAFSDNHGAPIKLDGELIDGHVQSGRIQLELADWDSDGDPDLIYGQSRMGESYKVETTGRGGFTHVDWLQNVGTKDRWVFKRWGAVLNQGGIPLKLGWHNCSPVAVDWNHDGKLALLVGSENGRVYFFGRTYIDRGCQ